MESALREVGDDGVGVGGGDGDVDERSLYTRRRVCPGGSTVELA